MSRSGRLFAIAAGVVILGMMGVTATDVALRFFLDAPLTGAFEVVEISMALAIFGGMSLAAMRCEHITVNLLESRLPDAARRWQRAFGDVVCAVVAAALAWRIAIRAQALLAAGETTLVLQIQRGYVAWVVTLLCAMAAGVFLWTAWRSLAGTGGAAPGGEPEQGGAL